MGRSFSMYLSTWYLTVYVIGAKRTLDLVVSALALITLSPIFAIVAIAIKVFDPGPAVFSQKRVGLGQKQFTLYKFRSMPINTGDVPSDMLGELKLSWIGRFIRRSNLDELPQLYNVFLGDMSLVGPRPALPSQNDLVEARAVNGAYEVRPGLTGLAQVRSYDGMPIEEKARFDCQYANSVTFLSDLKICFQTIGYLMRKPPVY